MEHLGTVSELDSFKEAMMLELAKHALTKTNIREDELVNVLELTTAEIHQRLQRILTEGPDVMSNQCIHIANYCMFLWLKLEEAKK